MESSDTGGVKPMQIAGRTVSERERLLGMTTQERAWRAQWLKDQHLAANEPVHVPELDRLLMNPIRRFYRAPLDGLQKILQPVLGQKAAFHSRYWAGKAFISLTAIYSMYYYFKYSQNDWTRRGGWRVIHSKTVVNPGDEGFPKLSERSKPTDYASRGFNQATI